MPPVQLTVPMWLALPIETRNELKRVFNIPRSEGSHVQDNEVVSDGHNHYDLAFVTVEKMQAYLNSKDKGFFVLFDAVLKKLPKPVIVAPAVVAEPEVKVTVEVAGKKFGLVEEKLRVPVIPSNETALLNKIKAKTTKAKKK